mmetsp:Transcript_14017/g.18361  ORF Transcript_14017/g.18361 Transcript_14017/m.18361 type:complete len:92 (+) Transcript_14017:110-385(+)|eukprot:CAMPEP_0116054194 /NCGR_PEP_ID=MMETSP0322-20121206/2640_1 /TAXON_ID=163516 /ORGANISM="Leptocylindrus danicus var. apora, Strain B651" /LENGTH=91 /DNA_ID=CAMNT_0003537507 /DNA_START=79 /DNA_END=354 /DNA_ORIENTATION=-
MANVFAENEKKSIPDSLKDLNRPISVTISDEMCEDILSSYKEAPRKQSWCNESIQFTGDVSRKSKGRAFSITSDGSSSTRSSTHSKRGLHH